MSDLATALDIVGARWALLVVERLLDGPQRYGDLQRDLGVPTNMLATRLRELEAAGVLTRLPLRHNTRAYALTDRGLALREAIVAADPSVRGKIDRLGNFTDGPARFLIHPYLLYRQVGDLAVFRRCVALKAIPAADRAACFVIEDDEAQRKNPRPLALKRR